MIQRALNPVAQRITLTGPIKDQLKDFLWLAQDIKNCPTRIGEIVSTPPTYYGTADAVKPGIGVIWFPPGYPESLAIFPSVYCRLQALCFWIQPFKPKIQLQIVY